MVAENRIQKKDAYYLYKANWNKESLLHLPYKSFDVRLNENDEITVHSNLDNVSLKVNGIELGTLKNAPYCIYKWNNVILKEGENEIIVVGSKNGKQFKDKAILYYIKDIHNNSKLKEIVTTAGSSWSTLFKEDSNETKIKKGTGVLGEEINSTFNLNSDFWKNATS